ncbi:MAG: hypothetical protein KF753_10690 [Caldilineaceae bacterium]|nr:hypothetical protein [Caldilineaceae bacterium]
MGELLVIAIPVVYIIWPIFAANYASSRGNDSAVVVIFFTSLVGLGPIVALFVFLGAFGKPLESELIDQQQRQCPNCGGFKVSGKRPNTQTNTYSYSCALCGYKWSWNTNTPWPIVQVRPDLIAQGEQKLQAEAAERRRQEEAAAAAYVLQQQRKK